MRRRVAERAGFAIGLLLLGTAVAQQAEPAITVAIAAAPQRTKLPAIAWLCDAWLPKRLPWPSDVDTYPICGIPWDTYFCVVECSLGGECPAGTACYAQDNGNALCL